MSKPDNHSSATSEPAVWRVMCTNNGATGYLYTEKLPFEPGPGVKVRREPEPLYRAVPQQVEVTDAMVKAGAAAMCCQAQTLGCAAQHKGSEFQTCMFSTFMTDARRCLEVALSLSRPQQGGGE